MSAGTEAHLTFEERGALLGAHCGDPFALLGPHALGDGRSVIRVLLPGAESVTVVPVDTAGEAAETAMERVDGTDLFQVVVPTPTRYVLRVVWPHGVEQLTEDPYSFGPLLGELDLHLFAEGNHRDLSHCLGGHAMTVEGVRGVRFAVWAPHARRVSVVGDFNVWDGRRHPMRRRVTGVWEIFVPRVEIGARYKYEILGENGVLPLKMDPMSLQIEVPPKTASIVADDAPYTWTDAAWMDARGERGKPNQPISIYEVHLASWRRPGGLEQPPANWDQLADELIPYVHDLGFTHLELLPIMGHPFGGSWGYQPLSLYAPHAEYGEPAGFARFVDRCHAAGLGVLLDWVPAHFPTDEHGLARFDGTALYEHADPREGYHQDWNTLIYNLGRNEVHGFLIGSALHWLEHFHVDGLRVDAVASMLYRDYSRKDGEWVPNRHGGRENLESVEFLRHVNDVVSERCPGVLMIAEESTSWPGVTRSTRNGGLGFHYKWNMGWMHDTLAYMEADALYRNYVHERITFGIVYANAERYVLPLSHDEIVHGKRSLLGKMPGDRWQQFANLRAYYGFLWAHPGKKLVFMGAELAQEREWNHDTQLDWDSLSDPLHRGTQSLVRELNALYTKEPALHQKDSEASGFEWLVVDDRQNSVFAFVRRGEAGSTPILVVSNFTPVPQHDYRIGVTEAGTWHQILSSDAESFGGAGMGNAAPVATSAVPSHGRALSIELTVPPLATMFLRFEPAVTD